MRVVIRLPSSPFLLHCVTFFFLLISTVKEAMKRFIQRSRMKGAMPSVSQAWHSDFSPKSA